MIIENIETRFFAFENDFVGTLKCIPMIVRYKLDTCRIKLKLADWVKLNFNEKDKLAQMPCYEQTEIEHYAEYVQQLVWQHTGSLPSVLAEVDDRWTSYFEVPEEVHLKAAEWECPPITLNQWASFDLLERFALVKLSRSGHEGKNFPAAVREFCLPEKFIKQPPSRPARHCFLRVLSSKCKDPG
jgi:hypothetical protein